MSLWINFDPFAVCEVCGLDQIGHDEKAEWLDLVPHDYKPTPATPAQLERVDELTAAAYEARKAKEANA